MKLKIEIKMDNAAFEANGESRRFRNGDEPARILKDLVVGWKGSNLEVGEIWNLHDHNGNQVGQARVTR
jgi:hypothetical protein